MKKIYVLLVVLCVCLACPVFAGQEEEQVREEVSVVNIEVPVRVFYKGRTVDNLSKADFKLYEGKKLQEINGFFIKKKKIRVQNPGSAGTGNSVPTMPPRYFVLIFRITDYNEEMRGALRYVMDNILRKSDQLLVFANNKSISFNNLRDKKKAHAVLDRVLREQAYSARYIMTNVLKRIESETEEYYRQWIDHPGSIFSVQDFLTVHLKLWREYKKNYLIPDMSKYFNFAKHLEKIKKEKWVINFYQVEMFPKLKNLGTKKRKIRDYANSMYGEYGEWARILNKLIDDLDKEMDIAMSFPVADISKLFYKVDATFHSIFIRSNIESFSRDYEYKRACTDIENSLRKITEDTGGSLIASTDLHKALGSIEEKETVYYLLTYAPDDPQQAGKIKVKVNNKKYRVVYDDNMRTDYITEYLEKAAVQTPTIQLQDLVFKGRKLSLIITDFLVKEVPRGTTGKVNLRIRIKDENNKVLYDKNKTMQPQKESITISIPFKWLTKGKYDIIADVKDLMTGKTGMKLIQPVIR